MGVIGPNGTTLLIGVENSESDFLQLLFDVPAEYDFIHNRRVGTQLPEVTLQLLIDDVDVSDQLVGSLSVNWPEDSNGSCSFDIKNDRPFRTIPVQSSGSIIQVGASVVVKSITEGNNTTYTYTIFTGKIVDFNFDFTSDLVSVQCLDMSYDVSRSTDRLNIEFANIALATASEVVTLVSTRVLDEEEDPPVYVNVLQARLQKIIDKDTTPTENAILGMWLESDIGLENNLLEDQDSDAFTALNIVVSGTTKGRVNFYTSLTDGDLYVQLSKPRATRPNFRIKYQVDPSSQVSTSPKNPKKSQLIAAIASAAGVTALVVERAGLPEDEPISVPVTANNEFPLDMIEKVSIPQTWRAHFDEFGTLRVGREIIKARPDFIYEADSIIQNTLKASYNIDDVINRQQVAGVLVTIPGGTNPGPGPIDGGGGGTGGSIHQRVMSIPIVVPTASYVIPSSPVTQQLIQDMGYFYHTQVTLTPPAGYVLTTRTQLNLVLKNALGEIVDINYTTSYSSLMRHSNIPTPPQMHLGPVVFVYEPSRGDEPEFAFRHKSFGMPADRAASGFASFFTGLPVDAEVNVGSVYAGTYAVTGSPYPLLLGIAITIGLAHVASSAQDDATEIVTGGFRGTLEIWSILRRPA